MRVDRLAALEATLREPSDAVIEAGRRAVMATTNCHLHDECPDCPKGDKASCREIVRAALRAALDAASPLTTPTPTPDQGALERARAVLAETTRHACVDPDDDEAQFRVLEPFLETNIAAAITANASEARAAADAEVAAWRECALYDPLMEGPAFKGWNRSALDRCRRHYIERALATPAQSRPSEIDTGDPIFGPGGGRELTRDEIIAGADRLLANAGVLNNQEILGLRIIKLYREIEELKSGVNAAQLTSPQTKEPG